MKLRVVTYNIHKGIGGVDRRYRPERVAEMLRGLDPDLVFLQEVDDGVPRSRGHRQVDWLGDALGFEHRVFYPNVFLRRGSYGNALLSRFPIDHSENIDLTIPLKKNRAALHARLNIGSRSEKRRLWLFNVHLGLAGFERRRQLRRILAWLVRHHPRRQTEIILGGDFNDVWERLGPNVLEPARFVRGGRGINTFPAVRPLRALDHIFVRGRIEFLNLQRVQSKLARAASDHLPLVADLEA